MHCVENLPAALSFSAICGSRLQRVENQRRDRQFSTIGLLWHVPCRGPRDRSVGERDGVRQIAATPHRGLDLRVAVRGASDGASMLEAGVGIIHSTDSAVDHCRQRTAASASATPRVIGGSGAFPSRASSGDRRRVETTAVTASWIFIDRRAPDPPLTNRDRADEPFPAGWADDLSPRPRPRPDFPHVAPGRRGTWKILQAAG
jgi:hypothetical protein